MHVPAAQRGRQPRPPKEPQQPPRPHSRGPRPDPRPLWDKGKPLSLSTLWTSTPRSQPQVAFYFAFIQTYVVFLTFPAVTGLLAWQFLAKYSLTYAVLTSAWCTVFLEYWKIQEVDLSIRWDVRGVGAVKVSRPQFRWEKRVVDASGRVLHHFPRHKQVARQLLQIPFMVFSTVVLGAVILAVFALETLISEGYEGPYKKFVVRVTRHLPGGLAS